MPDEVDWSVTTFEGNRRRPDAEFLALSFRKEPAAIEELGDIAGHFASGRTHCGSPIPGAGAEEMDSAGDIDHG